MILTLAERRDAEAHILAKIINSAEFGLHDIEMPKLAAILDGPLAGWISTPELRVIAEAVAVVVENGAAPTMGAVSQRIPEPDANGPRARFEVLQAAPLALARLPEPAVGDDAAYRLRLHVDAHRALAQFSAAANRIQGAKDGQELDKIMAEAGASLGQWRAVNPNGLPVVAAADLVVEHLSYREPLIDGLLREGEVMNIVASPKVGKSWLVLLLALCVSNGVPFLGRACTKGTVLIVDNELHPETSAMRLRAVAEASGLSLDGVHLVSLRGQLRDLPSLASDLIATAKRLGAKVVVLDALYRLLPAETSENDNSGMMQFYNCLDRIATESGAAPIGIHHSSKGNQAEKSTTDGGAGAGAISRAADAHVFLRQHEDDGLVVVDAVARSWPPMAPFVIRREGAVWVREDAADPAKLKGRRPERAQGKRMPLEEFLSAYLPAHPEPLGAILATIGENGAPISRDVAKGLLELAVSMGKAVRETGARGASCYGREPTPESQKGGAVYDRVRQYILANPKASVSVISAACDCPERTVYKVKAKMDPAAP